MTVQSLIRKGFDCGILPTLVAVGFLLYFQYTIMFWKVDLLLSVGESGGRHLLSWARYEELFAVLDSGQSP